MSTGVRSSSVELPVPKRPKLDEDEIDGWEDEWDKVFDCRANSKRSLAALREYPSPDDCDRMLSILRTRGYDPIHSKVGFGADLEELDLVAGVCMVTVTEVAYHAINLYNFRKSKNLEFVWVIKANRLYGLCSEVERIFMVSFLAQEEGNPDTMKIYQARAHTTLRNAIVDISSFRPKPIERPNEDVICDSLRPDIMLYYPRLTTYCYESEEAFLRFHNKVPVIVHVSVVKIDLEEIYIKPQLLHITCDCLKETIGSLKKKIEKFIHFPANQQKLNGKGGYMIKDSLSLAAYNVKDGDILFLGWSEDGDGNCMGGGIGGGGGGITQIPKVKRTSNVSVSEVEFELFA